MMRTLGIKHGFAVGVLAAMAATSLHAQPTDCSQVPTYAQLRNALRAEVMARGAGGLNNHMWATVVNRWGQVCAVAFSGDEQGDQWTGSRLISAQKANTAAMFSNNNQALSTANLYSAVQPGGALFGLANSQPLNQEAYRGQPSAFGSVNDPLVGLAVGGINTFGGGLPLYNSMRQLVGGLGVSGDTSCADHIIAWRVRDRLQMDFVPGGFHTNNHDNLIEDMQFDSTRGGMWSQGGWGHPACSAASTEATMRLGQTHPIGNTPPAGGNGGNPGGGNPGGGNPGGGNPGGGN
jgi:uncharacterized protein GlcG (DUF336 family)